MRLVRLFALLAILCTTAVAEEPAMDGSTVENFANLALRCIHQEYPNKIGHVMNSDDDIGPPRELTPAFFGCFDWHSSVHGHWMLVRLLKLYPDHPVAPRIRASLNAHLTTDKLEAEAAYFREKHNKSFERMYGWAWALRLVAELHDWDDAENRRRRVSRRA